MTFNVVNSTLTVNNNVEISSNYTVTTLGGRSGSKLDIKGSVIQKSGYKGFNFMSVLGSIYGRADSVKAGKIQFENKGRISINSSYTEVGSVEFGSYAGRLDLGITDTQGAEVSYRIGGINGGNPDALVTTAASDSMIGNEKSMFTTIVLTPDASKSFSYNGIISNSLEIRIALPTTARQFPPRQIFQWKAAELKSCPVKTISADMYSCRAVRFT